MSRSKSSNVVKKAEPPKKSNELTPAAEKSIESLFEALCDEEDPEIISMVDSYSCFYRLKYTLAVM